jgi:hypothetical protein
LGIGRERRERERDREFLKRVLWGWENEGSILY